jgi:hypothetical protein
VEHVDRALGARQLRGEVPPAWRCTCQASTPSTASVPASATGHGSQDHDTTVSPPGARSTVTVVAAETTAIDATVIGTASVLATASQWSNPRAGRTLDSTRAATATATA